MPNGTWILKPATENPAVLTTHRVTEGKRPRRPSPNRNTEVRWQQAPGVLSCPRILKSLTQYKSLLTTRSGFFCCFVFVFTPT